MRAIKRVVIILSLLCLFDFVFGNGLDVYKEGVIEIIPDSGFGEKTEWDAPRFHKISSITLSEDGSIYAAVSRQHKIYKFDSTGKLLLGFGQKGQGPSDMTHPRSLSVLDDKYLVVCEYASNRRISIFDLKGNFVRVIRTDNPPDEVVSLRDNKIAVSTHYSLRQSMKISIFIKDIKSDKETLVLEKEVRLRRLKTGNSIFVAPSLQEDSFIRRTAKGNLLVGFSYSKELVVYSPEGLKLNVRSLSIPAIPVTGEMVSKFKKSTMKRIKENFRKPAPFLKKFKAVSGIESLFSKHLPYYSQLLVDGEGNILVFHFYFYLDTAFPPFQVYTSEGNYLREARIDFKEFVPGPSISNLAGQFVFQRGSLYCILGTDDGGDITRRIVCVKLSNSESSNLINNK